ncbi:MAG TPA: hypothetical protein DEV93_02890, partial [Chloroflexi bacterium]|nr:hypothetical protein [Chloroflexota bacterium]
LARDLGIAPRRLWGWEPTTRHEYEDGVLVASTPDPEFDASQYELLAALMDYEADLGPHGQLISEAMSTDADPGNQKRKYRFVAGPESAPGLPLIDFAAQARDKASEAYYKQYPDVDRSGHVWVVRKVKG